MQMDSDLVIYRTTLVWTFQVVTICRVDKSETDGGLLFPVVDLIRRSTAAYNSRASLPVILVGARRLDASKALSAIHRGSWGDVARRFTMIRWLSPKMCFGVTKSCEPTTSYIPEPLRVTQLLVSQFSYDATTVAVEIRFDRCEDSVREIFTGFRANQ
ncbi:hypothetical protein F511_21035 [Dorcoceras hygrometricum]|uniref:Uncharacterized protein n=1 Tax=Dorcoceras hygrometricum TaxID=472368 RepID=A0A2Z7AMT2_9LAMI|nr:hypothetical protein F511_21035 [Dorcoceras hygrometricum]